VSERKIVTYIPMINSSAWTGGTVYINNLLYTLKNYAPEIELYQDISWLSRGNGGVAASCADFFVRGVNRTVLELSKRLLGYSRRMQEQAEGRVGKEIDVIFTLGHYPAKPTIATLCWLTDFQHVHLPEMFSKQELMARDYSYRDAAKRATLVVLSSHDALKDFSGFAPEYAAKGRVMQFVAYIPEDIYRQDPAVILKKYDLPEKFVYLPNQFWKHKNHQVVFEAVSILKKRAIKLFVVCTGNTSDERNPTFFQDLKKSVRMLGLDDQVAFLGLIPHDDVYHLVRQCVFVVNPSLFEGWSTTVEETKSVGKRILLSNIGVHREQNPPAAVYFDPRNAEDLAVKLEMAWVPGVPGPDTEMETHARNDLPKRMERFAKTFVAIAQEGMAIVQSRGEKNQA
jgi:glycosyltransferase involved in cell wall biosynthesis